MRILQIITRSDLGGAQSVVVNLANYFVKEHEVIVAAGDGDGKMWGNLDASIRKEYVPSLKRELSLINELRTIRTFKYLQRKYHPDIIHLHSSKVGILGRISFPKKKIVYTVHGFDSIRIAYRKYLPIERSLQRKCAAIVGVSKYDEKNLLEENICNNVVTIYNGIAKPQKLTEDPFLSLSKYKKKVLCIARLSPPKNIDLFLEIARNLPQYAFIWIGNQQEPNFDYSPNVFFWGSISNAGAYIEFVDLFILTSNYEGLPMTIIEAMSMGKPIVTSDVGGISEIVLNGVNGYVLENRAELFVDKIKSIFENEDMYNRYSLNSIKQYESLLTVDSMANEYMKIYKTIFSTLHKQ